MPFSAWLVVWPVLPVWLLAVVDLISHGLRHAESNQNPAECVRCHFDLVRVLHVQRGKGLPRRPANVARTEPVVHRGQHVAAAVAGRIARHVVAYGGVVGYHLFVGYFDGLVGDDTPVELEMGTGSRYTVAKLRIAEDTVRNGPLPRPDGRRRDIGGA